MCRETRNVFSVDDDFFDFATHRMSELGQLADYTFRITIQTKGGIIQPTTPPLLNTYTYPSAPQSPLTQSYRHRLPFTLTPVIPLALSHKLSDTFIGSFLPFNA